MQKILSWGLIMAMILLCLSGCGGESSSVVQEAEAPESAPVSEVTAPEPVEAEEPEAPAESLVESRRNQNRNLCRSRTR